jgi:hypothetical protein
MRSFGFIALAVPLLGASVGCADLHSVSPPRTPKRDAPVDIGPIVDESGVDLGPVVAARINERKLGDAHYVSAAGENPFVSGRVQLKDGDAGVSGANKGGITLLAFGLNGVVLGGTFFALGTAIDDLKVMKTPGAISMGIGAVFLAGAIALLTQPSRFREGALTASLDVRRGDTSKSIQAVDKTTVHHDMKKDEQAGGPLLDGVVNAITTETSH